MTAGRVIRTTTRSITAKRGYELKLPLLVGAVDLVPRDGNPDEDTVTIIAEGMLTRAINVGITVEVEQVRLWVTSEGKIKPIPSPEGTYWRIVGRTAASLLLDIDRLEKEPVIIDLYINSLGTNKIVAADDDDDDGESP